MDWRVIPMVCRINHRVDFAPVVKYASKASKHAELVASSLSALTPAEMITEFQELARLNTRCKRACVHVVLSPAAGERLTGDQWRTLCERTAQELGASQWVAFRHKKSAPKGRKKRVKITPELKEAIVKALREGKTAPAIADEQGVSPASVNSIKKDAGLVKARKQS